MLLESDLLQDIKKVMDAEVWFYVTGATRPMSPAQVPACTAPHLISTTNQNRGQSEAQDGEELGKTFVLLPSQPDPESPSHVVGMRSTHFQVQGRGLCCLNQIRTSCLCLPWWCQGIRCE